jgi:flagellar hook-associated protein 1 FlgK
MGTLSGALNIALQSLLAQQGAIDVTANNIGNANTPGYSRQRPILTEDTPDVVGNLVFGTGVSLQAIQSVRDQTVELRIQQEMQTQGSLNAFLGGMNQVQSLFNEAQGIGLQTSLSNFFNSLQALSADPSSLSLRQSVLNSAQSLATAFHQAAGGLAQIKASLDSSVGQAVSQVNQLTLQIAKLNTQIAQMQNLGENPGQFVDQRDQLIEQLSNQIDVAVIPASDGTVTLTTAAGAPLVVEAQSYQLAARVDAASATLHVFDQGTDITAAITGGALGGLIQARDQALASDQATLDNLAADLGSAFNAQHQKGFDLSGAPGGNFFVPFTPPGPGSNAGAAAQFALAITDPSKIAASSDGTVGSNGNVVALAALQNQPIIQGQSPTDYYANLVQAVGLQVADANTHQQASNVALQQLENQRSAVSGVSINEEAANLVKYQQAFDAAAQVVSVVSGLMQTVLSMGAQR